jgi:hypothetical protein
VRGRAQAEYLGYLRNSRIGITMQPDAPSRRYRDPCFSVAVTKRDRRWKQAQRGCALSLI